MGRLLSSLIAGFVTGETRQAVRYTVRAAVFYGLALLSALLGIGFLLGAAFMVAAERYGSLHAALGFGSGFIVLALLILLVHMIVRGVRRKSAKRRRNDELTAVAAAAGLALLPTLLRGKGAFGLIAAPLAVVAYAIYRENRRPDREGPDRPPAE